MAAWKIASGELPNLPLLQRVASLGQPVVLSSGMSSMEEIGRAVQTVQQAGAQVAVLQCTSEYPCPPENVGLNIISELRESFHCPVGLSDHSGTIFPGLAAATLGIEILEVHLTMSREMFGPDVPASVTSSELRTLIAGIRFIEAMRAHPIDKDEAVQPMQPLRETFTQSIVARRELVAGSELTEEDLTTKKPGTGLPPNRMGDLVGRRLRRSLVPDEEVHEDDLEPPA